MEIKFDNMEIPCLMPVLKKRQSFEETQELRLGDDMPDIGRILGAWGQILLRSKDWRSGQIGTSGGVMVWVLYIPEDGGEPRCVETWVPFQVKWDFADTGKEGKFRVDCALRSVDARSTSARKMMIRVGLGLSCEAWIPERVCVPVVDKTQDDVYLLWNQYPVMLPVESGEKVFVINEELTLPGSCPQINRIIRYDLHLELIDQKVVTDKAVFRGSALLRVLYCAEDGQLYSCDFEIPFSQFTELNKDYTDNAKANFWFAVTNLEVELGGDGTIRVQGGITGQYTIYDRTVLELVEDAYCINKMEELKMKALCVPEVLDLAQKTVEFDLTKELDCQRIADVNWCVDEPELSRDADEMEANLHGTVQVLYYDSEGAIQSLGQTMDACCAVGVDRNVEVFAVVTKSGNPSTSTGQGGIQLHADARVDMNFASSVVHNVVEGISFDENAEKRKADPSLMLLRSGGESLWNIAKMAGSSVDAIKKANQIYEEPEGNKMLLIPVLK